MSINNTYSELKIIPKESYHEISFKEFMNERSKIKKNLYILISFSGLFIAIFAYGISLAAWGFYKPFYSTGFNVILTLTVFFRVTGVCIFSVVPTNEIDVLKVIADNEIFKQRFIMFLAISWFLFGILDLLSDIGTQQYIRILLQVIPTFLMSGFLIWLYFKNETKYEELIQLVLFIFIYLQYFVILNIADTRYNLAEKSAGFIFIPSLIYSIQLTFQRYIQVKTLIKLREEEIEKEIADKDGNKDKRNKEEIRKDDEIISKYNVSLVYNLIYLMCFMYSLYSAVTGIRHEISKKRLLASVWFLQAVFDLIPLAVVRILGSKFCFTLCARIFEFDVKRQQKDGAFMAALISMCQARPNDEIKGEEILWINRNQNIEECSNHLKMLGECNFINEIDRKIWMKAVVQKSQEKSNYIRIDSDDDMNFRLRYFYKGVTLITEEEEEKPGRVAPDCSFTSWLKYFEKYDTQKNEELQTVQFWYPPLPAAKTDNKSDRSAREVEGSTEVSIAVSSGSKEELDRKAKDMLDWGGKNLRKFKSQNFFETKENEKRFRASLFTTSPRDLSKWTDEDEKEFLAETTSEDNKILQEEIENEIAAKENGLEEKDIKICVEENMNEYKIKWKKTKLFNLSENVVVSNRFSKIDYFISHSWLDNAMKKCHGLEAFIDRCNSSGKSPSFWLDKVCIDQNDTTKGIEALPINIGACREILILMGKTYMKRLWCIW